MYVQLYIFSLPIPPHSQNDMVDLNQIMRDMASMVVEQGDTIGGFAAFLLQCLTTRSIQEL